MESIKSVHIEKNTAILLIHCPDQQGILAAVTEFLNRNKGNIIYLDQHVDREEKLFYMRVEWELDVFAIPREKIAEYFETLVASRFHITFWLHFSDKPPRMAVFVSKLSHCLFDILARYTAGEWDVEIPLIISNHEKLAPVAQQFGIDFEHVPITKENKAEQEQKELQLLKDYKIDFVVLAGTCRFCLMILSNTTPTKLSTFTIHFFRHLPVPSRIMLLMPRCKDYRSNQPLRNPGAGCRSNYCPGCSPDFPHRYG